LNKHEHLSIPLTDTVDPRELSAQGEIIVVTVQYRLGSFGFLFLDDDRVPGNVGVMDQKMGNAWPGNTKGGSVTIPLTSCLTGLDLSVLQIKTKCHTADSKRVKQEVNSTMILPPLVFPGLARQDLCSVAWGQCYKTFLSVIYGFL